MENRAKNNKPALSTGIKTKEEVLAVALEVFVNKGYEAANMKDIAEAMATTRTPIYYYFNNKLELYKKVVDYHFDKKNQLFIDVFNEDSYIFDKLYTDFVYCTQMALHENILFLGVEEIPELQSVNEQKISNYNYIRNLKNAAAIDAIKKGELRPDTDITEFVNHIYVIYFGLRGMMRTPQHVSSIDSYLPVIDTIIEGMKLKYGVK